MTLMTTQADKAKQKKKRALKKKHEHETEHMHEEAARHKVARREETVVIVVILLMVPFLLTGIIFWPTSASTGKSGAIHLADGTYSATCLSNKPANGASAAYVTMGVKGQAIPVTVSDLSGNALADSGTVFGTQTGQQVDVTVKNGFITDWVPAASP
jgi:hypothetical protein